LTLTLAAHAVKVRAAGAPLDIVDAQSRRRLECALAGERAAADLLRRECQALEGEAAAVDTVGRRKLDAVGP
jgi:hypothetical protein